MADVAIDSVGVRPRMSVASSFGLSKKYLTNEFPALQIVAGDRVRELSYRMSFYKCTQHDWKVFDFNGTMRQPNRHMTQPLIGNNMPDFYVPLEQRRPATPYRLARTIVTQFTTFVFGYGRWPTILSDDPDTQSFANALVKACKLKTKMIRARNLGGSAGTVGLSWGFKNGQPKVQVHSAKNVHVQEWTDEDEFIPAHVVELYQYELDVYDATTQKMTRTWFWHRRDWTPTADIEFLPIEVTKQNPNWQIDEDRSCMHNDGCHFVWIRNIPDDSESSIDGEPDYTAVFEQFDSIDILNSTNVAGSVKNLDPTLVIKMHADEVGTALVRKGSDHSLAVGPSGDVKYLELSGTAVTTGHNAIQTQRDQVLECCSCVIPDPNEVVAAGTSSVALKITYAPMISKGDVFRDQYGEGILRLLTGMIESARQLNVGGSVEEIEVDEETGVEVSTDIEYKLNLPMKQVKVERLDSEGNPTGEFDVNQHPQVPGAGTLDLQWPDYFQPTSDDKQKLSSSLSIATGGRPVMSQQTATEHCATTYQRDPQEEWARIRTEQIQARREQSEMFPGVGGEVDNVDELPEGASTLSDEEMIETNES